MRARFSFCTTVYCVLSVLAGCKFGACDDENSSIQVDPNGYITYCPCMGRFGNQADHFLGSLAFAKALNRTLVLPHWIVHRPPRQGGPASVMLPFDRWFEVEPLQQYHRVILMKDFMSNVAPSIWPEGKRTVFCYASRANFGTDGESKDGGCNAKSGNPFGPFWDSEGISFDSSEFFGPLSYDAHRESIVEKWKTTYPPEKWPVLAFVGAPASFPVQEENVELQKYLKWNEKMVQAAETYIREKLPRGPVVGIHLRNGVDWGRACEHLKPEDGQAVNSLFSSPQCVGYRGEKGALTPEMCLPSTETVIKDVKKAVKRAKAKSVFVATDNDPLISALTKALAKSKVTVISSSTNSPLNGSKGDDFGELDKPQLDLAVLGRVNHFVGNCVSSFSAFVRRERDATGFPSSWFGFPPVNPKKTPASSPSVNREEL